ncbi:DUF305 domain-containing protein [Mesorhizobium sp. BE184]|uniref:CopM family metallochaperone n=1 Tax=Mesorhizobium sp. BE184 TaxID=2817714 RepID=UPI002860183D|nr:DUF305 domain-containing protein [Mesorhizobium sp. BE184]MDR7033777.1 uncharacterized protein (DUF305 family) [Mesorhizobium sp. BE184]
MTPFKKIVLALMAAGMLLAVFLETAPAQDHKGHDMSGMTTTAADGPSTEGYRKAMDKMHGDMAIPYTGNADIDFVRGMIPHHQGAIDMAKVELEHGKDPEIRKLAETVIKAQEAEIKQMQEWLAAHAPK